MPTSASTVLLLALAPTPAHALAVPKGWQCSANWGMFKCKNPQRIYIEDTDAYGVVYWANYFRFFERAAVAAMNTGRPSTYIGDLARKRNWLFGMHAIDGVKYSVPAVMGDACEACVEPLGMDESGRMAFKASLVRCSDGVELLSASDCRFGFVSAESGELDVPFIVGYGFNLLDVDDEEDLEDSKFFMDAVKERDKLLPPLSALSGSAPAAALSPRLEPDNLYLALDEAGSANAGLSIHAAARYFERHRTTYLGGPNGLQSLADEYSINVVVGRVNGFRLEMPEAHKVQVGTPLELRCHAKTKFRGTQVIFEQWLLNGETQAPLARAEVLCLALSRESGKMVPFPKAVLDGLKEWEDAAAAAVA